MENFREKRLRARRIEEFESQELKVNLKKIKVMIRGLKEEIFKSKVDQCAKCDKRVMANSVLCAKCGKWMHGRCAKIE